VVEIVSATRLSGQEFLNTALGTSLRQLNGDPRIKMHVALANRRGLPEVYNARITAPDSAEYLIFLHDDVWIGDCSMVSQVLEGLKVFDVIGVAGNRRRVSKQPAWAFVDLKFTWDERAYLSGAVAHGANACGACVMWYGKAPAECELLDGVFLAVRKSSLLAAGVLFDPRFPFHFYDMDFCRAARQKGLRLGTWPICITHQSIGDFGPAPWVAGYQAYLAKWGD
jgi:GT2 family glycosyltransferase